MPRGATHPKSMSVAVKQAQAMRLRAGGMTFRAIADELGYRSEQAAYKAVKTGLQKTLREPADELRTLEAERLDRLLEGLWEKAISGDTWSVDRVLNIMKRRAELLGLDSTGAGDVEQYLGSFLAGIEAQKSAARDLSEQQ